MRFILAVIHFADLDAPSPDRYEPIHAYDTIDECWREARVLIEQYDGAEAVVVCLAEQP
jgi:hypothetical protein